MKIKEKDIYIFIFLIAFFIRFSFFLYNYNLPLSGDGIGYDEIAVSILAGHTYCMDYSYSNPPGYPFFVSIIYFFFGHNFRIVRIFQLLLDSGMCALIYWLCRRMFNRAIALIAAIFSIFYLLFIKSPLSLLTEPLFTFLLFLTIVYIYKSKERFSYFNAIVIGLLVAILTLTRAMMLLFIPFLVIILLIVKFYNSIMVKKLIKKIAVMTLAFILPVSIWTYRNYKVYHVFVPISTQGGYAFYDSYFPRNGKIYGVNAIDDNVHYALSLGSQTEMSDYLFKKTIEFIKNNPLKVLRLELLKILYFWCPFDWELMMVEGIYNFQYVFMFPFSIFGMILLLKNLNKYAPLYIPTVYCFLIALVFYGSPRFRMPVEPYLIIFFAVGIFRFFKRFSNKYIPLSISVSYAFINFIMYLKWDLVKCLCRDVLVRIGLW